jgi:hypothetical protein
MDINIDDRVVGGPDPHKPLATHHPERVEAEPHEVAVSLDLRLYDELVGRDLFRRKAPRRDHPD